MSAPSRRGLCKGDWRGPKARPQRNGTPAGSSLWRFAFASLTRIRSERVLRVGTEANMDNTTLLIIIVLVLLLFGGGYYGRGRWW